jgi:thiamine monophosphate synthase
LRPLCHRYETIFLINDRIDVGLVTDADGFQLGRRSLPLTVARQLIGEDYLLGASVHSREEALAAQSCGADFLLVGTIFASHSHPDESPSGTSLLQAIRRDTPIGADLTGTGRSVVTDDRKDRDGVNPSSTHLRVAREKMCRRGACPLATLAVAGDPISSDTFKSAPTRDTLRGNRSACPILAVGGITQTNARQVMQAGADGIAVISAILGSDNVTQAVNELRMAINL